MHLLNLCLLGSALLAGCTLTADDVEPALPKVPLNDANTVAYHCNGRPVVAHNYTDIGSVFLLFLGPFYSGPPVQARLRADSTLSLGCVDAQNVVRPGYRQHALVWQLSDFQGTGRYRPTVVGTGFRVSIRDAADEKWLDGPQQVPDTDPGEVVVTQWNPTTRRLIGTFTLRFKASADAPTTALTDGAFDVTVSP